MTKKWLWVAVAVGVPVVAGGGWVAGGGMGRGAKATLPPDAAPRDPAAVAVTTEPVAVRDVPRAVEAVGSLFPYEEVILSAKVEGRVRRIMREVADRVSPGDPLLEIDPTDYQLSQRQAERALQVELARLGLEKVPPADFDVTKLPAVEQAAVRLDRAKTKLEAIQGVGVTASRDEINDRTADVQAFQAEYRSQVLLARAVVKTAYMRQEALAMADQQLRDTVVATPQPTQSTPGAESLGTYAVSQRSVAEGAFVRTGTELFRLVIDQALKLRVPVPERFSADVKVGQGVNVTTAAYRTPFAGTVTRVAPTIDPVTRTFKVEVLVPNPNRELKPGGFAKASIITQVHSQAVTVPLEAVVTFAGIVKIFIVEDGKAKEVQVTLGTQGTKWVEIATPALPPGAIVVTSGHSALADGTPVTIRAAK